MTYLPTVPVYLNVSPTGSNSSSPLTPWLSEHPPSPSLSPSHLQGAGALVHHISRLLEGPRRLVFALGSDDLCPGLAGCLRLGRHGPLQLQRQPDVLDLDPLDLDTPRVGSLVQAGLHLLSDGLSLR